MYLGALLLSVGLVDQTLPHLEAAASGGGNNPALANALRQIIASVKFETWSEQSTQSLATEFLAGSYYQQSRGNLPAALTAARKAAEKSPTFGFAWERVAELEFSFGHTDAALEVLNKSLALAPRNPQAIALKGFLLAAQNRMGDAMQQFDEAIAIDGSLGNAWLGRGLCKIRQGNAESGREDLEVAAALEPNRAVLRSYLGKAFSQTGDDARANHELELARKFDPNDPTSWLYSALLHQQQNHINEAIRDLEKSKELNDNRSVFRSRMLLDQDEAVRGANLASVYSDAGMDDVSVREATRAVNYDYANYSAHLFLANSYNQLRDPNQINLRYETPWLNEYLLANLLAPVGAGTLSQNVSQQEYSKLFQHDGFGVASNLKPGHLRRIKSLALLNDEQLAAFLDCVEVVTCGFSETLFREGQPGDSMFLILEGEMRVYTKQKNGEILFLRMLGVGDAFGEVALLNQAARSASVEAVRESVLIKITSASLQKLVSEQPAVAARFLLHLAKTVGHQLSDLTTKLRAKFDQPDMLSFLQ